MHILLIADGRSPITRSWVKALVSLGHQVTLITTFPCAPVEGVEADVCLPVAFSALSGSGAGAGNAPAGGARKALKGVVASFRSLFLAGRYQLGPLTLRYYGPRLRWLIERIKPDLVHALRIPFEGMLASWTPPGIPLVVSIWGNDLTLHAHGSGRMAALTRKTLARADALVADARRDIRLGQAWGFDMEKPTLVVPGNGGLVMEEIEAVRARAARQPEGGPLLVLNPRGFRTGSVRQDTFFQSLPFIYERRAPGDAPLRFACAAMAEQREALQWVERLKLQGKVDLLPHLPQPDLWDLFARAAVSVSISEHDGTPNSLLEAMALGAFPIAGDIESIREWITPGVNGLLVEASNPQALAEAVLLALNSPDLRARAAAFNAALICERAASGVVREKIDALYAAATWAAEMPPDTAKGVRPVA